MKEMVPIRQRLGRLGRERWHLAHAVADLAPQLVGWRSLGLRPGLLRPHERGACVGDEALVAVRL
jgi:hypothetical protein